jgi:hypothetical protein
MLEKTLTQSLSEALEHVPNKLTKGKGGNWEVLALIPLADSIKFYAY